MGADAVGALGNSCMGGKCITGGGPLGSTTDFTGVVPGACGSIRRDLEPMYTIDE